MTAAIENRDEGMDGKWLSRVFVWSNLLHCFYLLCSDWRPGRRHKFTAPTLVQTKSQDTQGHIYWCVEGDNIYCMTHSVSPYNRKPVARRILNTTPASLAD